MLQDLLVRNVWLSLVIWGITYVSDYYLTLCSARLYITNLKEQIVFGGSYELTPQFQKDVDALRVFRPRFVLILLLSAIGIFLIWALAVVFIDVPQLFALAMGGAIFRELAVHARHVRNIVLFRAARGGGISGRIEYARWLTLRLSAAELLTLGGLFLAAFLAAGVIWFSAARRLLWPPDCSIGPGPRGLPKLSLPGEPVWNSC